VWRKFVKTIAVVVPAPVVIFVNLWFGLFRETYIAHPSFAGALEKTASGFAVALSLVLFARFHNAARLKKQKTLYVSFFGFLLTFALCILCRFMLREAITQSGADILLDLWAVSYFVFLTSLASLVVCFALLQLK